MGPLAQKEFQEWQMRQIGRGPQMKQQVVEISNDGIDDSYLMDQLSLREMANQTKRDEEFGCSISMQGEPDIASTSSAKDQITKDMEYLLFKGDTPNF